MTKNKTADKADQPLTLVITNLETPTGSVIVGVYAPENNFPGENDQLKVYKFKPDSLTPTVHITDLPYGTYALAIYQDVNENGKIDKNWVGIPTEPYAFSNNVRPLLKAPDFDDCKFNYDADSESVEMDMIR